MRQRIFAVQQACLVWTPIESDWQFQEFVQRGVIHKPEPPRIEMTPELSAKIAEYHATGKIIVDEIKPDGSKK